MAEYQLVINERLNEEWTRFQIYDILKDDGWRVPSTFDKFNEEMNLMGFEDRGLAICCDMCCRDKIADGHVVRNEMVICKECSRRQ